MVRSKKQLAGLTLIELAVTLVILAFLAMVAAPFSMAWANNAAVAQALATVREADTRARAVALRNPKGIADATLPAAMIKLDASANTFSLYSCDANPCTTTSGNLAWKASIPSGASVQLSGSSSANVNYNNRGLALDSSGNTVALTYSISKGSSTEEGQLQ